MNKTTAVGYADAITYVLTILAALPYTIGDEANIIPPVWKAKILIAGLIAGAVLKIIKGHVSADVKPEDPKP